jgi:hypothetical protein
LYPWHPWHGRVVLTRRASGLHADLAYLCIPADAPPDARLAEIPRWMFDAGTCAAVGLQEVPRVDCAALRDLRSLLNAKDTAQSSDVLQGRLSERAINGDADGNVPEPEKSVTATAVLPTTRGAPLAGPRRSDARRGSSATRAAINSAARGRSQHKPTKSRKHR